MKALSEVRPCSFGDMVRDGHEPVRQATELSLGIIFRTLRFLLGGAWRPRAVCFRHPPPKDLQVHLQVFDADLLFNSNIDGIACRAANLDDPLPGYDSETARYIKELLDAMDTQPAQSIGDSVR